ncbi:GNAT family N-acetyltransferase [Ornithinibacillus halotolerans]|uniref:Acetoin utilization protein AcuA n=1 Tax=Ornithinibacillus halotolerans TaxID=1274357 RepID=A0A916WAD9_9BACI|nr:GNAT family N-acetyltransferase [Ornithinibacillus halotolerans]GGA82357.1 acetoin utilization protein AcuA [Ornithinibacillus halotolerans]
MEHIKTYNRQQHQVDHNPIIIEGPIPSSTLKGYSFHEGLNAFRPATKQFQALLEIADLPEGRIIIARERETIIGYVTYLHPDPLERWSTFQMQNLIELGAIEVAPDYRSRQIASNLIRLSMMDPFMENYIIISTEYYWHWDLKGTGLNIWEYRKAMEKMMATGGLLPAPTDDPEINSHPANCLMVRIGSNVDDNSIKRFEKLRFLRRYQNRSFREGL